MPVWRIREASVEDVNGGVRTGTPGEKRFRARSMAWKSAVSMGDSVAISDCSTSHRSEGSPATSRSVARNRCGSSPGSRRQSSEAVASAGMTLIFSLPERPVIEIVVSMFVRGL